MAVGVAFVAATEIFAQSDDAQSGNNSERPAARARGDRGGDRGNRGGDRGNRGGDRGGRAFAGNFAGGFGGGFGGGNALGTLLQNDKVKKHFALTEEQTTKLQKIADEQRNAPRPNFGRAEGNGGRPAPPTEEDFKKFGEELEKRQAETKKKINEVLTADQQEKFKALPFQIAGGLESRYFNPQQFEFLKLSDDQKAKFQKISEEVQAGFRNSFNPQTGDRPQGRPSEEEIQKRRAESQKRTDEIRGKVLALLTPEQKALAEKLTAEAKQLDLQRQRDGERGNREGRGDRDGRNRGGSEGEYRPNSNSWTPGSGTPADNSNNRRRFPRGENTPATEN
jgi:Spy/CpxP family protein refolding chaperone